MPFKIPYTLLILLVARPSLIVLNTGIPPPTDASNSKLTLFFSASLERLLPCLEINALLGVTTWILFLSANSTIFLDIPSDWPMASIKISILLFLKILKGSL